MVDLPYLTALIALTKANNIQKYKDGALELTFHVEQLEPQTLKTSDAVGSPAPDQSFEMPDLKADEAMKYDDILNWSGSPDESKELPLTGEQGL